MHQPAPRPLWHIYLAIFLPMMATNALQSASGAIDGIYLGQFLGIDAVAAVSTFFPVMFSLLAIVIGISSGATVLIGQAWGAGNRPKVRAIAATAVAMMALAGLVISITGIFFAGSIIRALQTPAAVQTAATLYARVLMGGMPVIFTLWLVTSMSRGVGDAVSPLRALAIATAAALLCTPALILGWGVLPRLGVVSAAVSNIASYLIGLLWICHHWRSSGHPLAPSLVARKDLRFDTHIACAILKIGIPAALHMLALAAAEMALLHLVNRYGTPATAAYGAINQVMGWVQMPVMSLGITASVLASHAIGAGWADRIGPIVRTGLWLNLAATGGVIVLATIFSRPIIALFIADANTAAMATTLLRSVLWSMLALGASSVLTGVMRADGTVAVPTALSAFAILCVEVPAAYQFEAAQGLTGIWFGYATAFMAMLILQSLYFRLIWRRKPRQRLI